MITSYELEFLPVGDNTKCGDCILFRYIEDGVYKIIAYDGGTKASGEAMVAHVKKYYGTERIDYLVNSHPDSDHVQGLIHVLETMDVGEVWIHQPWDYSAEILDLFHDGRMTANSLSERMKDKLNKAHRVYTIAKDKGIPVHEPFAGGRIGPFTVLSPDRDWYMNTLVPNFSKTPKKSEMVIENILDGIGTFVETVKALLKESWGEEHLPNNVETSAENDSSVILYADIQGKGILLTGDSGVKALAKAVDYAEKNSLKIKDYIKIVQVPHHGSRRNISTETLNNLLGNPSILDETNLHRTALVSASTSSQKHPRDRVVNAFMRRGFKVVATKGSTVRQPYNMSPRDGWITAKPLDFSYDVDDTDN